MAETSSADRQTPKATAEAVVEVVLLTVTVGLFLTVGVSAMYADDYSVAIKFCTAAAGTWTVWLVFWGPIRRLPNLSSRLLLIVPFSAFGVFLLSTGVQKTIDRQRQKMEAEIKSEIDINNANRGRLKDFLRRFPAPSDAESPKKIFSSDGQNCPLGYAPRGMGTGGKLVCKEQTTTSSK